MLPTNATPRRITTGQNARDVIRKCYDFALGHVGQDKDSYDIWQQYINFLKADEVCIPCSQRFHVFLRVGLALVMRDPAVRRPVIIPRCPFATTPHAGPRFVASTAVLPRSILWIASSSLYLSPCGFYSTVCGDQRGIFIE